MTAPALGETLATALELGGDSTALYRPGAGQVQRPHLLASLLIGISTYEQTGTRPPVSLVTACCAWGGAAALWVEGGSSSPPGSLARNLASVAHSWRR